MAYDKGWRIRTWFKQYQILPDTARMQLYGISLNQLMMAVSNGNGNTGGDVMSTGNQRVVIRGLGMMRTLQDMRSVVVANSFGSVTSTPALLLIGSPVLYENTSVRADPARFSRLLADSLTRTL